MENALGHDKLTESINFKVDEHHTQILDWISSRKYSPKNGNIFGFTFLHPQSFLGTPGSSSPFLPMREKYSQNLSTFVSSKDPLNRVRMFQKGPFLSRSGTKRYEAIKKMELDELISTATGRAQTQ